jgi:hypothetical membrane protein
VNLTRPARIGALCWIVAAPLFLIANVVTGLRWRHPAYSWAIHNISDLGNIHCGVWDTSRPRYVCSPWHPVMNAALLITAGLLAAGLVLTGRALGRGVVVRLAQSLLALATLGYALAGRYPADVNENAHVLGALLILVFGNLGLLLAGFAPGGTLPGRLRPVTLVAGGTALAGTVLFAAQQGPGIGVGGMERVAVFPFLLWACCLGGVLLVGDRSSAASGPTG